MASCLTISGGVASVSAVPAASCTGWLVLDQFEYQSLVQPNGQTRQENFADGVAVGWEVAAVLVAAWCWVMMRKATQ